MMKQIKILLIFILAISFGCDDNTIDTSIPVEEQFAIDLAIIDNWLADTTITDILIHSFTQIRYTVNSAGNGLQAQAGDVIKARYEGRFLDTGEVFDSNTSFDFVLNSSSVITGWYHMLQEMKEGDEFTIYLPSKWAYGPRGSGSIPPNTVLVFDISLIRVGN